MVEVSRAAEQSLAALEAGEIELTQGQRRLLCDQMRWAMTAVDPSTDPASSFSTSAARSAVGVGSLPRGWAVEVEAIFELQDNL